MIRSELDGCFVMALSYWINLVDGTCHYKTLNEMQVTMDYDQDGHAIISNWSNADADEPLIVDLLNLSLAAVNSYSRLVIDIPSALNSMCSWPTVTSAESAELLVIGGLPVGSIVIIDGVASMLQGGIWNAII